MGFSRVRSAQATPTRVHDISVEADVHRGLFSFSVVGMPDQAVEESKDRVTSALRNAGFSSPKTEHHKVTISLSPAQLKKGGAQFDVPIALSYLLASQQIRVAIDYQHDMVVGELGLDGSIQKIQGAFSIILHAQACGVKRLFIPLANQHEVVYTTDSIAIYGVQSLQELIHHLDNTLPLEPLKEASRVDEVQETTVDFSHIYGQETAKRALLIAAVGMHNITLYGPPGTGKTMLARAFHGILPPLTKEQSFEVTSLYSAMGKLQHGLVSVPPFRSPHHTTSHVALVGGGTQVRPGEITYAHNGVLFLDEFPEFEKRSIESLRQPLEDGVVHVSRAKGEEVYPARFILVAAMNPCPCGFRGAQHKQCICKETDTARYERKVSGPIVDRIDIWVPVEHVPYEKMHTQTQTSIPSSEYRNIVQKARQRSSARNKLVNKEYNRSLTPKDIQEVGDIQKEALQIAVKSAEKLALSPRSYFKLLKVARTIADIEDQKEVTPTHVLEALQYRKQN